MKVFLDIETYSSVDLTSAGVYNYIKAEDFKILLLAYSIEDGPVKVIDFTLADSEKELKDFMLLYEDPTVNLIAHNANFERLCLNETLGPLNADRYICTMAMCAYSGIAQSLNLASVMLNLDVKKKIFSGHACMSFFCKPAKKTNKQNSPEDNPALWESFLDYVHFDVLTTRSLFYKLPPLPKKEQDLWVLDSFINDLGVKADVDFVDKAVAADFSINSTLHSTAQGLGISNLNSRLQVLKFCEDNGVFLKDLNAATVSNALKSELPENVKKLLDLKQKVSKSSTRKFTAIINRASADGRVRGMFLYYGAHTGRWSSRGVQLQNMPGGGSATEAVRSAIKREAFVDEHGVDKEPIAGCIRTSFIPEEGATLAVIDYSAIEARVLSWLANEEWRLNIFATTGAIYEASASRMFHIPIDQVTKGSSWRQLGKIAELALGYQGGFGALEQMSKNYGLTLDEAQGRDLVKKWRETNPKIVNFWQSCQSAVASAIGGVPKYISEKLGIYAECSDNFLSIYLPSGRALRYYEPKLLRDPREIPGIKELSRLLLEHNINDFAGLESAPKSKAESVWRKNSSRENFNMSTLADIFLKMLQDKNDSGYRPLLIYTSDCVGGFISPQKNIKTLYGGNLCNNITQAVARDVLAESMLRLHEKKFTPIMQVHDELVFELPIDTAEKDLKTIEDLMIIPPDWAFGLPLAVEGGLTSVYKKL